MMTAACYGPRLDDALALCAGAFRSKRRKESDVPYLAHLLWVAATVADHGGDEEQIIAALLHDYLEDVDGAAAPDLERRFGPRVARLIVQLSDTLERPKPAWRVRKEAYLTSLRAAPAEVKLISAADKLHNAACCVRDLKVHGDAFWGRFRGGRDGMLWYFRALCAALADGWDHPLLAEVGARVDELHDLAGASSPAARTGER